MNHELDTVAQSQPIEAEADGDRDRPHQPHRVPTTTILGRIIHPTPEYTLPPVATSEAATNDGDHDV